MDTDVVRRAEGSPRSGAGTWLGVQTPLCSRLLIFEVTIPLCFPVVVLRVGKGVGSGARELALGKIFRLSKAPVGLIVTRTSQGCGVHQ